MALRVFRVNSHKITFNNYRDRRDRPEFRLGNKSIEVWPDDENFGEHLSMRFYDEYQPQPENSLGAFTRSSPSSVCHIDVFLSVTEYLAVRDLLQHQKVVYCSYEIEDKYAADDVVVFSAPVWAFRLETSG